MSAPGRHCPLAYRYGAGALAAAATLHADALWVAGGLYGNLEALATLAERFAAEPGDKALVFNGDFHWFDVAPGEFAQVNDAVLAHVATRGNVETELAAPAPGAGCGCAYPEWVGDRTVQRSNRIHERLRRAAQGAPRSLARLRELPMVLVAEVAGERVAIVHGDAESLAGWGFSQERLSSAEGIARAEAAFVAANVRVFASSHSCLPVLQGLRGGRVLANNGSAGMPNFAGTRFGIVSRIATRPHPEALYGLRAGKLHVEAIPIAYDHEAWCARFLGAWPEGSDAHASYFERMLHGPRYAREAALRRPPLRAGRRAA
jgi:hypothetical protein